MVEKDRVAALIDTLAHDDVLNTVIKSAIFIEAELNAFFDAKLPNPRALDKLHLDFSQKCGLAAALGLSKWLLSPLSSLGNVRNKFAHRLDAELGKSEVDSFFNTFDPTDKREINESSYRFASKVLGGVKKLSNQERFSLCVLVLYNRLQSDVEKAANGAVPDV